MRRALGIAQAGFVFDKPEGALSAVSQGGGNLSGGQRQRLAIARAVASQARLFLFDDSFSALDYRTDAALRRALDVQLADVTRIVVAQRISTVMDADCIVVLEDGRGRQGGPCRAHGDMRGVSGHRVVPAVGRGAARRG